MTEKENQKVIVHIENENYSNVRKYYKFDLSLMGEMPKESRCNFPL